MGSFEGRVWKIYLDEEARERRDQILDYLQRNYDGPSDFGKEKLMDEDVLSPEERLERLRQDRKEIERKEEQLEQVIEEREQQKKLRDKRELLKQKQEKLREVQKGEKSEQQIREEVKEEIKESNLTQLSDEEYLEKNSDRIERKVESRLEEDVDVDELVQKVRVLQDEISDLEGEQKDYFMDLEEVNAK